MMGSFFGRLTMPLVACAALGLVGCSGGEAEDTDVSPTPVADTPTPVPDTPTPVPTSPAADDFFRVTEMAVGDSSEGVDLDDDGEVDNNIETALEAITAQIVAGVEVALEENEVPPAQQAAILTAVNTALEAVFTVDALSQAINAPVEGEEIHYILGFEQAAPASTDWTLTWNLGDFGGTAYEITQTLSTQEGTLSAEGDGEFGPANLTLSLSFTNPQTDETSEFEITLQDARTTVEGYNGTTINEGYAGGAVDTSDLILVVEGALTSLNELLEGFDQDGDGVPDIQIDVETTVAGIEETLTEYSDIDRDGDGTNESFSIGLVINASKVGVEL